MKYIICVIFVVFTTCIVLYMYNKNSKKISWEPACSTPEMFEIYAHHFYVKCGENSAVSITEDLLHHGLEGFLSSCPSEVRNMLPTGLFMIYAAIQERKIYKIDYDFSEKEKAMIQKFLEEGYSHSRCEGSYNCFYVCVLPGGVIKFIIKDAGKDFPGERSVVLDFEAKAEETHEIDEELLYGMKKMPAKGIRQWESIDSYFDWMNWEGKHFKDLETIKTKYGKTEYLRQKYHREGNFPMYVWEKYFERFNYKIVISFEDSSSKLVEERCYYTAPEFTVRKIDLNPNNIITNPTRLRKHRFLWISQGVEYETILYFNEEEVFQIYDEMFGTDRNQYGELRVDVSKYNNLLDVSLVVGDRVKKLEKTQIDIVKINRETKQRDMIYENYKGHHQDFVGM